MAKKTPGKPAAKAAETVKMDQEARGRQMRRRRRQWLGAAITVLILVGIFTIVQASLSMAQRLVDNTAEKEEYAKRVEVIVWFDLPNFSQLKQLDQNLLKQVCIWGALRGIGYANLQKDEFEMAILPRPEVDRYAAELFGPNFHFVDHATFSDLSQGIRYDYLPDRDAYLVPPTSIDPIYVPSVIDVLKEPGGIHRVVVGYVPARSQDGSPLTNPDYAHPVRLYDYMFRRDGSSFYLYAIQPHAGEAGPPMVASSISESNLLASSFEESVSDSVSSALASSSPSGSSSASAPASSSVSSPAS